MKTVVENTNTGVVTEFEEFDVPDAEDITDEEFFAFLESVIAELEQIILKK